MGPERTKPATEEAAEAMAFAVARWMADGSGKPREPGRRRKWTHEALASAAGVSKPTIANLLNARPGPYWKHKLQQVAEALGQDRDAIVDLLAGTALPAQKSTEEMDEIELRLSRLEADVANLRGEVQKGQSAWKRASRPRREATR